MPVETRPTRDEGRAQEIAGEFRSVLASSDYADLEADIAAALTRARSEGATDERINACPDLRAHYAARLGIDPKSCWDDIVDAARSEGVAEGVEKARAEVVAWLRAEAVCDADGGPLPTCKEGHEAAGIFADALEGGALSTDTGDKA